MKNRKSRIKKPVEVTDLANLAALAKYPEWKTFVKMAKNRIAFQKEHIIRLPELVPVKLAVDKAYDRGIISGLLLVIKNVETAADQMEKLASKEE
jgi:hypothetical protein